MYEGTMSEEGGGLKNWQFSVAEKGQAWEGLVDGEGLPWRKENAAIKRRVEFFPYFWGGHVAALEELLMWERKIHSASRATVPTYPYLLTTTKTGCHFSPDAWC